MSKETILPFIRHALQFIGGALVAKGWMDEAHLNEGIGIAIGLVTFVWYLVETNKKKAA